MALEHTERMSNSERAAAATGRVGRWVGEERRERRRKEPGGGGRKRGWEAGDGGRANRKKPRGHAGPCGILNVKVEERCNVNVGARKAYTSEGGVRSVGERRWRETGKIVGGRVGEDAREAGEKKRTETAMCP